MSEQPTRPWYKQFWPWFLIALPLSSWIMGGVILNLAINTSDSVVKDDYYKEGKAINLDLEKTRQARLMHLVSELSIDDEAVSLRFINGDPKGLSSLTLEFYHPTMAKRDFELTLLRTALGSYRAPLPAPISGKWRLSLHPYHQQWRIQQVVYLPSDEPILFRPE